MNVLNVQQESKGERERIKRLFKLILLKPNDFVTRKTNGFHESYIYIYTDAFIDYIYSFTFRESADCNDMRLWRTAHHHPA